MSLDKAYAFVGDINGIAFKLLRHHDLSKVQDGNEHDTVDRDMLALCIKLVPELPVSEDIKNQVLNHLNTHAQALLQIDEENAKKIINQTNDGGKPAVESPKPEVITNENVDIIENKAALVEAPTEEKLKNENKPGPTILDEDKLVEDPKGKDKKESKGQPTYSAADIIRNTKNGQFAIVLNSEDKATKICVVGERKEQILSNDLLKDWQVIVHPHVVKNSKINIENGVAVALQNEVLELIKSAEPNNPITLKMMPGPVDKKLNIDGKDPQNDEGEVNVEEKTVDNPNDDSMAREPTKHTSSETDSGKSITLFASESDFTNEGKAYIKQLMEGLQSDKVDANVKLMKMGTKEMVALDFGNQMFHMVLVKDGEDNPKSVLFDSYELKTENLKGLVDYLASIKASQEKTDAGAKFERCVADVLSKKVEKFKKDNGRSPTAKEKAKMKSSSFAICTTSVGQDK